MQRNRENIYAVWTFESGKFVSMHWDIKLSSSKEDDHAVSAPSIAALQKNEKSECLEMSGRLKRRQDFLNGAHRS